MSKRKQAKTGQPIRAAIYARVSTLDQATEGTSIGTQIERCTNYIAAHQTDGWTHAGTYIDAGVSGAKASRPDLDRLLSACRNNEIDAIVVTKLDRLGRNTHHLTNTIHEFDELGIVFASISESIDTSTPLGRMLRFFLMAFAEFERDLIRERTEAGIVARLREGGWPGGVAPYGFQLDPESKTPIFEPDEAKALMHAFEMLVGQHASTGETARSLNDRGLLPRRGLWNNVLVRNTFKKARHLTGTWTTERAGEQFTVPLPPLFTDAQWAQLTAALAEYSTGPRKDTGRRFLLSRRVTSACGATMHARYKHSSGTTKYQCANNRHDTGDGERCGCVNIDARILERLTWHFVEQHLTDPDELRRNVERAMRLVDDNISSTPSETAAVVRRRIENMERDGGERIAALLRRGVSDTVLNAAADALERDLETHRARLAQIEHWEHEQASRGSKLTQVELLAESAQRFAESASGDDRRKIIDIFNVRVTIDGYETCHRCGGTGSIGVDADGPTRWKSGRKTLPCPVCLRHKYLPRLTISADIPDSSSIDVEAPPLVVVSNEATA